jgi:hypothetical protein
MPSETIVQNSPAFEKRLRQVGALARDLLRPLCPAISTAEAIALLECLNGVVEMFTIPFDGMPGYLSNTLFSFLLEQDWGDGSRTLQEVIDDYDSPAQWGPEITDDPRIGFVRRLRGLTPVEAAALYVGVHDWWSNRYALGDDVDRNRPESLKLGRYFNIQD